MCDRASAIVSDAGLPRYHGEPSGPPFDLPGKRGVGCDSGHCSAFRPHSTRCHKDSNDGFLCIVTHHAWLMWTPEQIVDSLPNFANLVVTHLDGFTPEHQTKNRAAVEVVLSGDVNAPRIRDGAFTHELITLAFALDLLGRRAAARGDDELSMELFRGAHELFRGGNPLMRPTTHMKNTLTNALKVIVAREVKRIADGDSDATMALEVLEGFVISTWGSMPPQVSLSVNEMFFIALEKARADGEDDVAFHERIVRDNIETVLGLEIPTRLESVRVRWEEIGEHVAPAAVRVAQQRLRRPENLSELLPLEAWNQIKQAIELGDAQALIDALRPHEDILETNLRLRLEATADYQQPESEIRSQRVVDSDFLAAKELLVRRDSRALEQFGTLHYHRSSDARAKEWYAYALSLFVSRIDIHEIITLLDDAVKGGATYWTTRWNLACALRKIPTRADEALDVLLPALEDPHGPEVFEL